MSFWTYVIILIIAGVYFYQQDQKKSNVDGAQKTNNQKSKLKFYICMFFVAGILFVILSSVFGGNDSSRCTICGSRNIYYSSGTYGYCKDHFNDMLSYDPD